MLTDSILQQQFLTRILSQDTTLILEKQSAAASALLHTRTGRLMNTLGGAMNITSGGSYAIAQHYYPIYLRFLDIKARKEKASSSLSLYNRTIWKTIYAKTKASLKTEYNKAIEEAIYKDLKQK